MYYPVALANARSGADLYAGEEIVANFNAIFDWYLGIDGNAGARFDFVTVVLHEIGHGLGFYGSMRYQGGTGDWGIGSPALPLAYDWFLTGGSRYLLDTSSFPNLSTALGAQLVSGNVAFNGTYATSTNLGRPPAVHAPNPWSGGSSIAHLSAAAFPRGGPNSLMTPSLAPGQVVHDPGQVTLGILADMGWTIAPAAQTSSQPKTPGNVRLLL